MSVYTLVNSTHGEPEVTTLSSLLDADILNVSDQCSKNFSKTDSHQAAVIAHGQSVQVIITFILFGLIVIGNAIVIVAILKSKTGRRSRMNFFILNLAAVDLSAAFFSVLPDAIFRMIGVWYAGGAMCKIVEFLKQTVTFASTYVLVALSIDRLDAIARPMSFGSSGKRAKILIIVAWVISILFASPALYMYEAFVYPCTTMTSCGITALTSLLQFQVYIWLITIVLFIIPTLIIAICYAVIIHVIWSKSKMMTAPTREPRESGKWLRDRFRRLTSKDNINGAPMLPKSGKAKKSKTDSSHSSSRGVIPQAKIRTIKMTLVIVTAFIVCWSPFFVHQLMQVYQLVGSSSSEIFVTVLVQSLGVLNNLANPIIYGIFSTRVCTNLREIRAVNWLLNKLCCCICKTTPYKRRNGHYENNTGSDFLSTTETSRNHTQAHGSVMYQSLPKSSVKKTTTQM